MAFDFISSVGSSSYDKYIDKQYTEKKIDKTKEQEDAEKKEKLMKEDSGLDANEAQMAAKDTLALYAMISIFANLG